MEKEMLILPDGPSASNEMDTSIQVHHTISVGVLPVMETDFYCSTGHKNNNLIKVEEGVEEGTLILPDRPCVSSEMDPSTQVHNAIAGGVLPVMETDFYGTTIHVNTNLIKLEEGVEEGKLILPDRQCVSSEMDASAQVHNAISGFVLPVMETDFIGLSTHINCKGAKEVVPINTLIKLKEGLEEGTLILPDRPCATSEMDLSRQGKYKYEIKPNVSMSKVLTNFNDAKERFARPDTLPEREESMVDGAKALQDRPLLSHLMVPTKQVQNAISVGKKNWDSYKGSKPHQCGDCDKSFARKDCLVKHSTLHSGIKPHQCGDCEKSFTRKDHLVEHSTLHTGIKPYQCGHCEKSFARKDRLVEHSTLHTGIKPYQCGHCEKSFITKYSLLIHSTLHTGIKPHQCGDCDKSFARKDRLVRHSNLHTGIKPYQCGHCEKSFARKDRLVEHSTLHTRLTRYQCGHCKKSFTSKDYLAKHSTLHTGIKPYKCGDCDKSFISKQSLVKHSTLHTGIKPFQCGHCKKSFFRKYRLVEHSTLHTGIKPYHFV